MPYKSTAQRGFIHAKAEAGVAWAKKFVKDADKAPQPTQKHVKPKRRVKRNRL
jgi:hypothetical protein